MPELVVETLELVDVEHRDAELAACGIGARELLVHPFQERAPLEEAGQVVSPDHQSEVSRPLRDGHRPHTVPGQDDQAVHELRGNEGPVSRGGEPGGVPVGRHERAHPPVLSQSQGRGEGAEAPVVSECGDGDRDEVSLVSDPVVEDREWLVEDDERADGRAREADVESAGHPRKPWGDDALREPDEGEAVDERERAQRNREEENGRLLEREAQAGRDQCGDQAQPHERHEALARGARAHQSLIGLGREEFAEPTSDVPKPNQARGCCQSAGRRALGVSVRFRRRVYVPLPNRGCRWA